ncbi:MAG: DUF4422 domain-containing protein, partial [Synergistaceae bacterium]|nr:DUF4422 domain-containing protein [Synergistaceae bacterium]
GYFNDIISTERSLIHLTEQSDHNTEPSVEVYVATHKKIDFEIPDYCKKIQVNAERNGQWEGYLHDNDNPDNISLKNPNYCELTALYAMWKNCDADIQGLCHYRRYFSKFDDMQDKNQNDYWSLGVTYSEVVKSSVTKQNIIHELEHHDIILPYPNINTLDISVEEFFEAYVELKDIRAIHKVLEEYYPDYLPALFHALEVNHYSACNMLIARRKLIDDYCTWLFDVLSKVEDRISFDGDDEEHARTYGYLSEILMNTYVHRHNLKCKFFSRIVTSQHAGIKRMLKKIPGLRWSFRLLHKRLTTESLKETNNFSIHIIRMFIERQHCFIARFTPKNEDNLLVNLEEAMNELKAEASRENRTFLPQIVLSKEAPESLRKSLWDSGVRILEG